MHPRFVSEPGFLICENERGAPQSSFPLPELEDASRVLVLEPDMVCSFGPLAPLVKYDAKFECRLLHRELHGVMVSVIKLATVFVEIHQINSGVCIISTNLEMPYLIRNILGTSFVFGPAGSAMARSIKVTGE